ncbi:winged helix-turn-helix transcriptional regulator [Candidatus Woesearchaeota archaeon]|nr:winged helix-turn-helix transcriptional regulator [Candidatus Woesearchaeota archaeon]
MDITLDRESFKALAAETRIKILKSLHQRRKMQSELAAELEMKDPSVNEHLTALVKAGLVVKKDDGHKWKYYELTQKGKAILDPEEKRFFITLALLVLSAVGGIVGYVRPFVEPFLNPQPVAMKSAEMVSTPAMAESAQLAMDAQAGSLVAQPSIPWGVIAYFIWLALLVMMLAYSYYQRKKYSQFLHHR